MTTIAVTPAATGRHRRWARLTTATLLLWGLLHIVGGAALMMTAADPLAALQSLGSAAAAGDFPADPGPVTQALIGFHGLNLLWAGLAIAILSAWSWRQYPRGVPTSLFIAAAADIGLIIYLLIPGLMKLTEGIWGPLLLAIAAVGAARAHRHAGSGERS